MDIIFLIIFIIVLLLPLLYLEDMISKKAIIFVCIIFVLSGLSLLWRHTTETVEITNSFKINNINAVMTFNKPVQIKTITTKSYLEAGFFETQEYFVNVDVCK